MHRMSNTTVVDHPLVEHHLAVLRDKRTLPEAFRGAMHRLTYLLVYEAAKDLATAAGRVTTPMAETEVQRLSERIGVVPILRAGLGMVEPVLTVLPGAEVWHLGFYRDERTLQPVAYYQKLPPREAVDVALVVDPMLATGGSAVAALNTVKKWGVGRIKLLAAIAAPEGIQRLTQAAPNVQIYVCAVDEKLNEHGYIVPGLGDAGDRVFNARAH